MGNNPSKRSGEAPASPKVNESNSHVPSRSSTQKSSSSSSRRKGSQHSQSEKSHVKTQSPSSPRIVPHRPHPTPETVMGNEQSRQARTRDDERSGKSKAAPVKVPHRGSDVNRQRGPDTVFEPSGPPRDPDLIPHSNLGLPPRLPLPIGEELHTPGSPILDAQGSTALHEHEVDGVLPRQQSNISDNTLDGEELGNELRQDEGGRVAVPTRIHWKHGGEKVYVTGTFTNWNRKFRMTKDPATGYLSTQLQLPAGTHHVKFIVDGEMQLSSDIPTAVDYTNILVNYIEVSLDDIPKKPETKPAAEKSTKPTVHPPQVIPQGIEVHDHAPFAVTPQLRAGESKAPEVLWGRELPPYLKDYDKPEHGNRNMRATRAVNDFPPPPGLPMFLAKSILNGTTPMKDDNSVLNVPNHTVLNHLATSNIKDDVLATSITTRYMQKYVTTIVYKPIEEGT